VPRRIQILVVEDNDNDAELMVAELRRAGFDFDWQLVDTEPAYQARLHPDLDLILCDYDMPQFNGFRAHSARKPR